MDADLQEKLIKLGLVSDTLASAWGKGAKSLTALRLAEENLVETLIKRGKLSKQEAEQAAKQLIEDERAAARQAAIDKKREEATRKVAQDLLGLTQSAISSAQSIHSSDKAFTSVTPTLEMMGQVVKTVSTALTGLAAGIPIVEGLTEATNKVIGIGTDLTIQVAKMQLEMSQQFVDTYTGLSKVGVNFGGNIDKMIESAAAGGLSLMNYNKFVNSSIESLKTLGGTVDQAASRVMKMSQAAMKNNERLIVEYGGMDQVAAALANFESMLTKSGINTVSVNRQVNEVSGKYLESLKVLEAITGRTAKEQQALAEEAMRNAAFQRMMQKEGPEGAAVLTATLNQMVASYGDSFKSMAIEILSTGDVTSKANSELRAFYPAVYESLMAMNQNRVALKGQKDSLEKTIVSNQKYVAANEGAIQENIQANEHFTDMSNILTEGIVKTINDGTVGLNTAAQKRQMGEAAALKAFKDQAGDMGKSSRGAASAMKAQNTTQMKMDKLIQDQIDKMADLVVTLNDLQVKLIDTFGPKLQTAVNMFAAGLKKIATKLGIEESRFAPPRTKAEQERQISESEEFKEWQKSKGAGITERGMYHSKFGVGAYMKEQGIPALPVEPAAGAMPNLPPGQTGISPVLKSLLSSPALSGLKVTSASELTSQHAEKSLHYKGRAADFRIKDLAPEEIVSLLEKVNAMPGVKTAVAEDKPGSKVLARIKELGGGGWVLENPGATGLHLHLEAAEKLAKGGITNGPSIAGEAGPEAVIPLPDGRNIPVKMDVGELITKLDEMIDVLKDQHYTSEKILQAQA